LQNDIVLQEDDSIQVYSRTDFTPHRYVAVAGAVRKGGQYPYRTGMTLRELLLMAGGPVESADLREAEVARFPVSRGRGVLAHTFRVSLDSTYLFERRGDGSYVGPPGIALPAARAPEVELRPYDNVLILRQPEWRLLGEVSVVGEVRFPGTYTITNINERLTDILRRSGGLTDQADPEAMVFYRRADTAGRIGVNLPEVMKDGKSKDNFVIQAGDSIVVSAYRPYVRVGGAVNSPVSVAYVPGRSIDYYINAAGGANRRADPKRAFVRQPNGSVEARVSGFLRPSTVPVPKAGATVMVPEKDPTEKTDVVGLFTAITPIVASAVTLLAVLLTR
jgi:protein involved in polysaccharide export with SLBB domain